eukprot:g10137.t2
MARDCLMSTWPHNCSFQSNKKLPTIRLEQILEETAFPEEVLDGSNQWLCPRCDRKVDAKRTTRLSKLPPYLHVTVERYHFEAETAQRKRLAHPVSFPRRLELRLGGALASQRPEATSSETAMLPVAYECIGYLEHVSDSAHSGHYRATLLREEEEPYVSAVAGDEVKEPALKRPKVDDPDAAAGAPQKRSWWRLDDESVTPVESVESEASGAGAPKAAEGTSSSSAAPPQASDPERIESATAYLVLYRRCDHDPGQLCQGRRVSGVPRTAPPLSSELQRCVDEHNTELRRQRKEFESNSLAVERFVGERRRAVMCLAEALRALHPSQGSSSDLNLVPSPWLERFLRGEDRTLQNILEGDASNEFARTGHALDPLAVWCGEVKLLPTAALEQVGGQFGGLDSSTFLRAEAAMNEEVATLVFKAFEQLGEKSNRFSVTDVRAVESSEQGFAVWISIRQLNQWKKVVGDTSSTASLRQLWRCFVQEVHEYRFGISPEGGAADAPEASDDEVAVEASGLEVPSDVKEATTPRVKPLTLLGGLLCRHQLLSRPRAAALVSRSQLEELLEVSHEKDSAFRELWQSAASMRPRALRPWSASGATPAASAAGAGSGGGAGGGEVHLNPHRHPRAPQAIWQYSRPSFGLSSTLTECLRNLSQTSDHQAEVDVDTDIRRAEKEALSAAFGCPTGSEIERRPILSNGIVQERISSPPAPSPGDKKRDLVVDRLRLRLVERRASELVAQLQRRQGDRWIQQVVEGGFHADEAMRRICEAFGLRPELERKVLLLVRRTAERWPNKVSLASLSSPSTSEDETWTISTGGEDCASVEIDSEEEIPEHVLVEAALKEVPELEHRSDERQSRIDFTDSEIRFFMIDEEGEADGDAYQRQLKTKAFDGPSGHRARKASICWCDEDSESESEEDDDWRERCDEMADLMSQQRQMVQLQHRRRNP